MKKTIRTGKPALTLRREHIRLLTPTDLQEVVGGATGSPIGTGGGGGGGTVGQSVKEAQTCNVIG